MISNCFIVYNLFYCLQWNYYTNVYIHGLASHQQPNHNIVHVLNELWGDRRYCDRMVLDLQLHVHSVPITTDVVSSNSPDVEVYSNIM